jgi:dihydrolipoamide dehydrogenase
MMISGVRRCDFMKGDMKINLRRLAERKDGVVEGSRSWISNLLVGNGVTVLQGEASFRGTGTVGVQTSAGSAEKMTPSKIVIATGAEVQYDAGLEVDGVNIWSTDDALALKSVPKRLAVVGAGNRGVEFASIYGNLGSQVVLIEREKRVLPRLDRNLAGRYRKTLTERQIKVVARTTLIAVQPVGGDGVALTLETEEGQKEFETDKVIVTGSRHPSYHGLNLEAAGLALSDGLLESGPGMETRVKGIYVVGDAAGPPYFAHKAIAQAMTAVDHISGTDPDGRPRYFPSCIYGDPEIGSIGLTENDALKSGQSVKVGQFYFVGNGRSGTLGNEQGVVQIVSDAKTGEVLGVHIIGPGATEIISLASLSMQNGVDVAGIKKTVFPHPTLSETFFEAALATDGEAIHLLLDQETQEPKDEKSKMP